MAVVTMNRFSLEQGLFGCCSSCHAAFGDELAGKPWASRDRQYPWAGSRSIPLPAAVASARGGDERSDWTPRAALLGQPAGVSPRTLLSSPPPALLVDMPTREGARRAVTPPQARDPAAKAQERARLRQLVSDFTQEAAAGRPCTIVVLDGDLRNNGGVRKEAQYTLGDEVQRFTILARASAQAANADGEAQLEQIGQWPLGAVLGTHRAEESALVQSRQRDLSRVVTREELARAAVLEFGGGAFAGSVPLLLIEESPEHCERFVSGMQILRLYKGAAQRLESARNSGDRRSNDPTSPGVSAPSVPASLDNTAGSTVMDTPTGGPSTPSRDRPGQVRGARPLGAIGCDDGPSADGLAPKETI